MILDASTLLAVLQSEEGSKLAIDALSDGAMSAANLSEVAAKLIQHGVPEQEMITVLKSFDLDIIPVDEAIAFIAGSIFKTTREFGLSLGDRMCIATGISRKIPVLTADKAWKKLKLKGLEVHLIR